MKQKTNLMRRATLLLLTMLCSLTGAWADELTVYDGTATSSYVPVYGWYADAYLKCEYVIPASELPAMNNGTISKMTYYLSSSAETAWTGTFQVFLKEVSETSISAYSGTEGATIVYEGPLDATGSTMEVDFSTNYTYNGGNLLVGFYQTVKGNYRSAAFYGQTVEEDASVQGYSSSSLEGITVNQRDFIPKTTFTYTVGSGPVCAKPETEGPYNLSATGATIKWSGGSGTYNVQYKKASASEWTTLLTNSTATSYNLTGLTSGTSYQFRVQSVCSVEVTSGWATLNFNTDCTAITTFPWTEDFESYNAGNFTPLCWTNEHIEGNGTKIFSIYTSTNGGNSTHQLYLPDQTSGTMTKLVLPEMILPGNNYAFVLDVYRSSIYGSETAEGIRVYASGDGEIEGATALAFIPRIYSESSDDIPAEAAAGWYTYELALPWSGTCYIILRGESKFGRSTYMDNFLVREATSCQKPTGLVASGVTAHTATITWTSDANAWQIQLGEGSPINVTEKSYTFTGLDSETAYSVKVRTNCGGGDYSDWTNAVSFTTPVSCPAPTGLTATLTPGVATVATLSWTENGEATSWVVQYATDSEFTNPTPVEVSGTPTTTLTGLTPETTYYARVSAVSSDGSESSAWSNTVTFQPTPKTVIGSGTTTYNYLPTYTYYRNSLTQQIYTAQEIGSTAGAILSVDFYATKEVTRNLDIYMVSTAKGSFESKTDWVPVTASNLVFSGEVTFAQNAWTTIELDNPFIYDGTSNVILVVDDNTGNEVIGQTFLVFNATGQALGVYSDGTDFDPTSPSGYTGTVMNVKNQIRLSIGEPPAVLKPTGLTVNYTGGTTAQVSWTSDATAFDIDVNGTVTQNVTNPYQLKNLYLATTYTVKVRAKNGSDVSDWTNPVSFTTDVCSPEDQKEITYELADSYGDGWDGAAINVVHVNTGIVVATLTLASGNSETGTISLCCGEDYSFVWEAGRYDSECSYAFYDFNEEEIFSGNGTMSDAVNYTMVCTVIPWKTPTNLKASEIGPRSVKLSWTERSNPAATAWVVAYKSATDADFTEVNAPTNPFTLTGLTPETAYTVKVRPATNEVVKWSDEITFVTNITAPSPTDLSVTPFVTTADVSWNGFAESYDVEWRENSVLEPSADALWLQYDNGTLKSVVGNSSANEWTWGVMYPANMLGSTNTLTKIAFYEADNSYFTNGSITVNVYSGGDNAPGTLIGTETIATTGTEEMREVSLSNPIEFDATQNLWITLTTNATYCMGMSEQDGGINSRWYFDGESWVDFGTVYTKGAAYSFMIRGFVDNVDLSSISWTTAEDVTSPYTIEGLDSETDYAVRVRGDFGADGESIWASTSFTTKSVNDIPIDLAATDITPTSAKLKWTGYQNSFNLKYRHSVTVDPSIPATVILTAGDIWGDGTGYQMLLDADATAYGTIIPTEGGLTTNGDASDETYAEFEYKIPTNADGALDTENIVINNSVGIQIPAGTYDWCITNPTPGDRVWIAGANGIGGRYDNFVFEPGVTYEFTVANYGNFDGVDLTVTPVMGEWTAVDNVTNPYTLSGLTPNTYCEWQVQGNLTSGTTAWSEVASFTTLSLFIGDVNGDGNRSITDAVAIVNYVLGNPPAGFNLLTADVNGDGKIDISDAVAVVNIVLNKTGK